LHARRTQRPSKCARWRARPTRSSSRRWLATWRRPPKSSRSWCQARSIPAAMARDSSRSYATPTHPNPHCAGCRPSSSPDSPCVTTITDSRLESRSQNDRIRQRKPLSSSSPIRARLPNSARSSPARRLMLDSDSYWNPTAANRSDAPPESRDHPPQLLSSELNGDLPDHNRIRTLGQKRAASDTALSTRCCTRSRRARAA
jgi:hypothetical protein